jgi:hypothetical protein
LEEDNQVRKDNGRNPTFCSPGVANKTKDVKFQMECGAAMFSDGYCKVPKFDPRHPAYPTGRDGLRKIGSGVIDDNYYWQGLNASDPRIVNRIKKFPGCFPTRAG